MPLPPGIVPAACWPPVPVAVPVGDGVGSSVSTVGAPRDVVASEVGTGAVSPRAEHAVNAATPVSDATPQTRACRSLRVLLTATA